MLTVGVVFVFLLVSAVNGVCPDQPDVQQCLKCITSTNCVPSSDNQLINCTLPPSCAPMTCSSRWHVCMSVWRRDAPGSSWVVISDCISTEAKLTPCDFSETCIDARDMGSNLETGQFECKCHGNLCNRNFLAGYIPSVAASSEIGSGSTTSNPEPSPTTAMISTAVAVTTTDIPVTPTPAVIFDQHDCITDCSAPPNCTLSADKRSMQCVVDDSCLTSVTRCRNDQVCSAILVRSSPSSPWVYTGGCLGVSVTNLPPSFCRVRQSSEILSPPSDTVETGTFFCSCLGARCNREFEIDLNDFVTSTPTTTATTTITTMPAEPTTTTVLTPTIEVTSSVIPTSSLPAAPSSCCITKPTDVNTAIRDDDELSGNDIIALSVGLTMAFIIIVGGILAISICIVHARHKFKDKVGQSDGSDQNESALKEAVELPVKPMEVVGAGRFGHVWKADLHGEIVACKILSFKDAPSWRNEQLLYSLPSTAHPNILEYIGSDQKGQGYEAQYLMVLKYCPLGSLSSHLKAHTLDWNQTCNFISSALAGVAHLHAECFYDDNGVCQEKPPIAHRDIKSSNFLVKNDTGECVCVLSDLGLSLQLDPNMDLNELANIGQVGTYRYMSPEALDASVNLQDTESFKQIDMYALALVLWEIASRCTAHGDDVPEYSLPFVKEVGERPTLEAMRRIVVQNNKRPPIPESWKKHEGLAMLAEAIPECWDQDPEARLTASGMLGKMEELIEAHTPVENHKKATLLHSQPASPSSYQSESSDHTLDNTNIPPDKDPSTSASDREVTVEANDVQ